MNVGKNIFFFLVFSALGFSVGVAQTSRNEHSNTTLYRQLNDSKRADEAIRVMFYNVENLFDPRDDTLKADEEYQGEGMRGWTYGRMKRKQLNIAKVVLAVGGWDVPELIGLCEVENHNVLMGLVYNTPLKNFGYKVIHYESPDPRGIDVALLYRTDKFKVLHSYPIPVRFPFDTVSHTRDILYVKGIACKMDTMHLFVNHWPSKFGGAMATIPKRNYVAAVLRAIADTLLSANSNANILIMGDLNDSPYEESVSKVLIAKMDSLNLAVNDLYNMHGGTGISWKKGTIKFREEWETIDHMIISHSLLKKTTLHSLKIFDAPFLLQDDEAWFGKKPFRTYYGSKYIGGYSDHLPIYADFIFGTKSMK